MKKRGARRPAGAGGARRRECGPAIHRFRTAWSHSRRRPYRAHAPFRTYRCGWRVRQPAQSVRDSRSLRISSKPSSPGQPQIEDDDIRLFCSHRAKCRGYIFSVDGFISLRRKTCPEKPPNWRFVIDNKDAKGARHAATPAACRPLTGNVMTNMAPEPPGLFSAVIAPFIACRKPRQMASPNPVPARLWSPSRAR